MSKMHGVDVEEGAPLLETRSLSVTRGGRTVVKAVSMAIPGNQVIALVGPSGCGKTTLLKSFNRMNDLDEEVRIQGDVLLRGESIYGPEVDPVRVRREVGMVFQEPNLFPASIIENVAFGPRVRGFRGDLDGLVQDSLVKASLWDEVRERLGEPAGTLSAGQKKRLSIARTLAVGPEVLLLDDPTSGLDPAATWRIEGLIRSLREDYAVVLATHNLQQAARVSDFTAVFLEGELVEYGPTSSLFTNPREERAEAYLTGRD